MRSSSAGVARPVRIVDSSCLSTSMLFCILLSAVRWMSSTGTAVLPACRWLRNEGAYLVALDQSREVGRVQKIEHDDWKLVVHAERQRRAVHYFEALGECIDIAQLLVAAGLGVAVRVVGIDAIHVVLRHEQYLGPHFEGAQRARCVDREIGIAGAGGE